MAELLSEFAQSKGLSSPDPDVSLFQYCKDLSWGALTETPAYRLYAPNKTRIENHINNEQNCSPSSTQAKSCP